MTDFSRFEAITFDCYGTLIDWESGIFHAVGAMLSHAGVPGNLEDRRDEILTLYARFESEAEAGPFRPYREVLQDVTRRFSAHYGFDLQPGQNDAITPQSWFPFADTRDALASLARTHRLAVVSNVDDDLFAATEETLEFEFDEVVTAKQIGSYKPGRAHFDEVLRRLELPVDRVLHAAQSLYHDIGPARALGFTTCWVNRRHDQEEMGATPASDARPDVEVPDLATLARLVQS